MKGLHLNFLTHSVPTYKFKTKSEWKWLMMYDKCKMLLKRFSVQRFLFNEFLSFTDPCWLHLTLRCQSTLFEVAYLGIFLPNLESEINHSQFLKEWYQWLDDALWEKMISLNPSQTKSNQQSHHRRRLKYWNKLQVWMKCC